MKCIHYLTDNDVWQSFTTGMRIPVSPVTQKKKGLHLRLFLNGKVGTAKLCRLIHGRSSLSVGDAKSTLEMLAQICSEELCEGREVHIEGAWLFCPYLEKYAESDPRLLLNRPFLTNFRLEMTNVLYWDGWLIRNSFN